MNFGGHGPDGRDWYAFCACRSGHENQFEYRDTREEALADMTAHMFEYGLTEGAIDNVADEDAREQHDAMLAPYLGTLRENPDAFKRSRRDEARSTRRLSGVRAGRPAARTSRSQPTRKNRS